MMCVCVCVPLFGRISGAHIVVKFSIDGGIMRLFAYAAVIEIRHNVVRNIVFKEAADASLSPEREKAGHLPDRPASDEIPASRGRRPADIWLPRGQHARSEAWDFAVTSAMQGDLLRESACDPTVALARCERLKRECRNTARACNDNDFLFVSMVLEAHSGGWGGPTRAALSWIAQQVAASSNQNSDAIALKMA